MYEASINYIHYIVNECINSYKFIRGKPYTAVYIQLCMCTHSNIVKNYILLRRKIMKS